MKSSKNWTLDGLTQDMLPVWSLLTKLTFVKLICMWFWRLEYFCFQFVRAIIARIYKNPVYAVCEQQKARINNMNATQTDL